MKGPSFRSYHTFLEDLYNGLIEDIDSIAERVRDLDERPIGSLKGCLEHNRIKEHDDEKSVMEIVMENEEYFDQVIKQINPYYEVPKNKEAINKLREKEDAIAKKRKILKNFNSVRTGAMLSERADRYIFTNFRIDSTI